MDSVDSTGSARVARPEQILYRADALAHQRYQFVGEPLGYGTISMVRVVIAFVAFIICLALPLAATFAPRRTGELKTQVNGKALLQLAADASDGPFRHGDPIRILSEGHGEEIFRVLDAGAKPCKSGMTCLHLIADRRSAGSYRDNREVTAILPRRRMITW